MDEETFSVQVLIVPFVYLIEVTCVGLLECCEIPNKAFLIRMWKPLPSGYVLKP